MPVRSLKPLKPLKPWSLGTVPALGLTMAMALAMALLAPAAALAQPKRLALLVGNSSYAAWPALETCRTSVNGLSGALKRAGFEVTERQNLSNAQMGSAISDFSAAIARAGDVDVVSYVCGYAMALDNRVFLLPASASLSRDTDALSQGIVSRLLINAVSKSGARGGLILLDAVALPGKTELLPLAGLVDPTALSGIGYAAVQAPRPPPAGMSDLAAATAVVLAGGGSDWRSTVKQLRQKLPSSALRSVVMQEPSEAAIPPVSTTSARAPPSEAYGGGVADIRRVQLALQRLGYYAGKVDGVVGADTLAAVRRFQHELRAEMTGQLNAAQSARLLKDSQ